MPLINARHVGFRKQLAQGGEGENSTLQDFVERLRWVRLPIINSQTVSPASAQFILVDSSFLAGTISIATTTTNYDGGIAVSQLAGAVGTAATTNDVDDNGEIINKILIRKSDTHDPVTINGREVFGLLQCASTAVDGDAIAAAASENVQISFAFFDSTGTVTLVALNTTLEFQVNKVYAEANMPAKMMLPSSSLGVDVISTQIEELSRVLVVTTAFVADEVLTLTTGAGATAGVSAIQSDSDDIVLPVSIADFKARKELHILLNGVKQRKVGNNEDVIWDSTNSFHFTFPLDIGDTITIEDVTTVDT